MHIKIIDKYSRIIKLLLVFMIFFLIFFIDNYTFNFSSIIYYVLTVVILFYDDILK